MEHINANIRTTILLCLTALVIASMIGVWTARWLIRPILVLSSAATAIESETYDPNVLQSGLKRQDEFGQLARIFYAMAEEVQARAGNLRTKIQQLQLEVSQAKQVNQKMNGNGLTTVDELLQKSQAIRRRLKE